MSDIKANNLGQLIDDLPPSSEIAITCDAQAARRSEAVFAKETHDLAKVVQLLAGLSADFLKGGRKQPKLAKRRRF